MLLHLRYILLIPGLLLSPKIYAETLPPTHQRTSIIAENTSNVKYLPISSSSYSYNSQKNAIEFTLKQVPIADQNIGALNFEIKRKQNECFASNNENDLCVPQLSCNSYLENNEQIITCPLFNHSNEVNRNFKINNGDKDEFFVQVFYTRERPITHVEARIIIDRSTALSLQDLKDETGETY